MQKLGKNKKIIFVATIFIFIVVLLCFLAPSFSEILDNDVRVAENSDLTYYIDVMYDGKDETEAVSSGTSTARVFSDYIYVEDKLPDGLEFQKFVTTDNGTIGAVKQDNPDISCVGYVVDGVDGLKFEKETRTVNFKVKNLQAGCKITIGIVTKTPVLGDKTRMDFYNTAFARENDFTTKSNTVHVFMGKEEENLYNVTYQYGGVVPDGVPDAPSLEQYPAGTSVAVSADVVVAGYVFSGWKVVTGDVDVVNDSFIMPAENVVFEGSFEAKPTYDVTYELDASGDVPDGYKPPRTKSYGEGDDVVVDSLKEGDEFNGYRFLGWEVVDDEDVIIEEDSSGDGSGIFVMPPRNVKLRGIFEKIDYQVSYEFQGSIMPSNYEDLLPKPERYYPGDIVKVADNPVAENYEFLGWYESETFEMPEEDVVIVGEWMQKLGTFAPTITENIDNIKTSYQEGDEVLFTITVKNNENFSISDVFIQEETDGAIFIKNGENSDYVLLNDKYVKIPLIEPKQSVNIKAKYVVGNEVYKVVTNKVSLVGALADNNYTLEDNEYVTSIDFVISNIELNINKINEQGEHLDGAEFALYEDANTAQLIGKGLSFKALSAGTNYYLKEVRVPTGYVIIDDVLQVKINSAGVVSIDGYEVTNDNGVATANIINKKINVLANTGGSGNIPYVIAGLVLIISAAFYCGYAIKRKEKK